MTFIEQLIVEFEEKHCQNICDVGGYPMAKTIRDDVRTLLTNVGEELVRRLEEQKEVIRSIYGTQMEERVHRIDEVDTAISIIREVTGREAE